MTYFEHTKRDLAEARREAREATKREAGEMMLALADDTSRKMDHEEFDRTYLLEDLLTRLRRFGEESGADVTLFESLANFTGRPAYDLIEAGEVTQEIPRGVAKPLVSDATIRQAAMLQTWDGGYPRHAFADSGTAWPLCDAGIRPVYGAAEGSVRTCGRPRNHEIHNLNPEA